MENLQFLNQLKIKKRKTRKIHRKNPGFEKMNDNFDFFQD